MVGLACALIVLVGCAGTAASPQSAVPESSPSAAPVATPSPAASPSSTPAATPTATPGPSGCVNPPPDLTTIVALDPSARLACFGGSTLTFTAIVAKAISDCGVGPRVEPPWFCLPGVFLDVPNPSATADLPPLDVYWNPTSGLKPASFVAGASVQITGHFDDPAAATCHVTAVPAGQSPPAPDQVVLACRETFIVSAVSGGG